MWFLEEKNDLIVPTFTSYLSGRNIYLNKNKQYDTNIYVNIISESEERIVEEAIMY